MSRPWENVASFAAGVVFAIGLALSGMTQPGKVEGFLDVFGGWDPALAAVMGGAIAVHSVAYLARRGWSTPLIAGSMWHLPSRTQIDARLVLGAVLFGVGWGVTGYCPGPAVMSLGTGSTDVLLFVGSMSVGMYLYARFDRWLASRGDAVVAEPRRA